MDDTWTRIPFSLVHGGPTFELSQRAHLCGPSLELLHRRILAVALLAWLPLLLLSLLDGSAFAGAVTIPFLYDVETHARCLIAIPLLIGAEVVVDARISPLIRRFVERRIVATSDLPAFHAAVTSAFRACNSVVLEMVLLVLVYTLGVGLWHSRVSPGFTTWYAHPGAEGIDMTAAGYWSTFVSIPIVHFLLLRWYARLLIWFQLLWRISRLRLHLVAAHPDRAGRIAFLGKSIHAFWPILVAQGTWLSGLIATRVLYGGQSLTLFTVDAASLIGVLVAFFLCPLVLFVPQLLAAKRKGVADFGALAGRYVIRFEEKWIRDDSEDRADLLGSSDIQSLADLGSSYQDVSSMRVVPFGKQDVIRLVAVTATPLLPLVFTMFSLPELVTRLLKLVL